MSGDQANLAYAEEGRAEAAPFANAFQSAFQKSSERAYQEKQQQQAVDALKPVAEGLRGVQSSGDLMKVVADHPEWMLNPKTAPYMEQAAKTWMAADKIKEDATRFDEANKIRRQQADNALKIQKQKSDDATAKINNSAVAQKDRQNWQNAFYELPSEKRALVESTDGATQKDDLGNSVLTGKGKSMVSDMYGGKPPVSEKTGKSEGKTADIKNLEYIRHLEEIGDTEGAILLRNHFKHRDATDKLTGEDAVKEKDLTKQIQSIEKELNTAKGNDSKPEQLISIQERLLAAQSQRHKLYQKLVPVQTRTAPTASTPSKKLERANALAKEHPNWSKNDVIKAVNDEFNFQANED